MMCINKFVSEINRLTNNHMHVYCVCNVIASKSIEKYNKCVECVNNQRLVKRKF